MTLDRYIKSAGRGAISKIAVAIGAPIPDVSRWISGKRPVPIARCVAIEMATDGEVSRKDLRPDDWRSIWPELEDK